MSFQLFSVRFFSIVLIFKNIFLLFIILQKIKFYPLYSFWQSIMQIKFLQFSCIKVCCIDWTRKWNIFQPRKNFKSLVISRIYGECSGSMVIIRISAYFQSLWSLSAFSFLGWNLFGSNYINFFVRCQNLSPLPVPLFDNRHLHKWIVEGFQTCHLCSNLAN